MENAAEALKIGFGVLVFAIALTVLFHMTSLIRSTSEEIFFSIDDTTYTDYSVNTDGKISTNNDTYGKRIVSITDIIPTIYRYTQEGYGVTIIDGDEIIARFDLSTEAQVASCIWKKDDFENSGEANRKKMNEIKYSLTKYLKKYIYDTTGISDSDLTTQSSETYTPDKEFNNFSWLNEAIKRIYATGDVNNPVYTSWINSNRNSNNYVTQRINCDLYGGTTYFNTKYPGVSKSNLENSGQHKAYYDEGLLKNYKNSEFIEYITEVDINEYEKDGDVDTDLLKYGTIRYAKQREIIYVKK